MKKLWKTRGARACAILAALIVGLILSGVIAGLYLRSDMTANKAVTLNPALTDVIQSMDKDVTVSALYTRKTENSYLTGVLAQLSRIAKNVTVEQIDPSSGQAATLAAKTGGAELADGSVVVSCGNKTVALTTEDLYSYEFDQNAYMYYGQMVYTSAEFTAQEALRKAIRYVTRDDMPVVYALTGHGENAESSTLRDICFDLNLAFETVTLSDGAPVPENAVCLVVSGPTAPVGDAACVAIRDYLEDGGDMIFLSNYTSDISGIDAVMAEYGMAAVNGVTFDNDTKKLLSADYKYYLKPELVASPVTQSLIDAKQNVILALTEPLIRSDVRRTGLNAVPLFFTSDNAYMKPGDAQIATLDQEENDVTGRFTLGMWAEENDTRILWVGSLSPIDASANTASAGANSALITEALAHMTALPAAEEKIPGANLLTPVTDISLVPALIAIIAIPLILLCAGLIIRKKRG